ncbi:DUF6505 family protein [Palleronia abyssalis]|uniref:Uncharacterized protein n=1 Tax=Palleronia abyssalis TaxID=1501240 RepID=A0A2R8BYD2_9RHOB|nr:DUF6505 family protein [Palleronia abyssalis]SPJ25154.1 hypothetical protein PAA8504_03001 [Palleronia abyssalis]
MQLARAVHLDESDTLVFEQPARTGEWCIPGGFAFADWSKAQLEGKKKQAFSNGWLGVETFGRVSLVAVARIEPGEVERLTGSLARHFVKVYGAPDEASAMPVAREQILDMVDLCADHDANTLLAVSREMTDAGVRETFRSIPAPEADLSQFAVHGDTE